MYLMIWKSHKIPHSSNIHVYMLLILQRQLYWHSIYIARAARRIDSRKWRREECVVTRPLIGRYPPFPVRCLTPVTYLRIGPPRGGHVTITGRTDWWQDGDWNQSSASLSPFLPLTPYWVFSFLTSHFIPLDAIVDSGARSLKSCSAWKKMVGIFFPWFSPFFLNLDLLSGFLFCHLRMGEWSWIWGTETTKQDNIM